MISSSNSSSRKLKGFTFISERNTLGRFACPALMLSFSFFLGALAKSASAEERSAKVTCRIEAANQSQLAHGCQPGEPGELLAASPLVRVGLPHRSDCGAAIIVRRLARNFVVVFACLLSEMLQAELELSSDSSNRQQ